MKHFIFTNFAIGISDELWLSYRFEIFENTVLPSLSHQSTTDFEWIPSVDKKLPELFKRRIARYQETSGLSLRFIEVPDYASVSTQVTHLLANINDSCCVTTRIDDDDCLHRDAIHLIHRQVALSDTDDQLKVISLKNGFDFLPSDKCLRRTSHDTLALGLTLVDYSRRPKSITQYAHHIVLDTLAKQGHRVLFEPIHNNDGLYLYTKHPLSDSFFFGARAKILADSERIPFAEFKAFPSFGLDQDKVDYLSRPLKDSPIGMPHKYLAKLAQVSQAIRRLAAEPALNASALQDLEAQKQRFSNAAVRMNPGKNSATRKIRIAIVGSCVSRDLFEFEKDFLSRFEVCCYSARSSIVSYMGQPNTDRRIEINGKGFEAVRAQQDLEKTHWARLATSNPDIVLLDFIDERIGLIKHSGSVFSASGPIIQAFESANVPFEILRPWSSEVSLLREWATPPFLERVRSICSYILIHRASWARYYYNKSGSTIQFGEGHEWEKLISLNNGVLSSLFETIERSNVPVDFIGGGDSMVAANQHKWGFSPIHFSDSYFKLLAKQLQSRVIL